MSPPGLRLRACAKVNLGLEVLGKRADGYHELRTLFQTIDLHDDVGLRLRGRDVVVRSDHLGAPGDASNLAARAAEALRRFAGIEQGVEITLRKRIPVGAGLGGGSSDAAVVLLGLDRMWRLRLGRGGLLPLARRLGADVPYFLYGGTALGLGRGDEVYPLERQLRAWLVVVDPERPVATAAVFARLAAGLTPRENGRNIFRFVTSDLAGVGAVRGLVNELEQAALEEAPDLRERVGRIREVLVTGGAHLAALTGSGSVCFGVFADVAAARAAARRLRQQGLRASVARTVTGAEYRRYWAGPARRTR